MKENVYQHEIIVRIRFQSELIPTFKVIFVIPNILGCAD